MMARPRPLVAAALAVSLAVCLPVLLPGVARAGESCPNEQAEASADVNLGNCLGDAREARKAAELRLAAAAYGRVVMFARLAYDAGKVDAAPAWFVDAGEQIVHYGTEGCALAPNLDGERAREVLGACALLLDVYLADLDRTNAGDSRSAALARQRRDELGPLLAGLPAPTPPRPAAPEPEQPAAAPAIAATTTDAPKPAPPRRPIGLDAGLGVAVGLAGVAVAGLVVGDQFGRRAHAAALAGPEAADVSAPSDVCDAMPSASGCADLRSARGLFIASGVVLGAALAATAVLAGLRIRHTRAERRRQHARVSSLWTGRHAGVVIHF